MDKSKKQPLFEIFIMLIIMLGMFLVTIILGVVLGVSGVDVTSTRSMMVLQAITSLMVMALPAVAVMLIYHRNDWRDFVKFDFSGRRWLLVLAGLVVMLLIAPLNQYLSIWNDGWQLGELGDALRSQQDVTEGILDDMLGGDSVADLLTSLLVIAVIPAISEELLFRVGLQGLMGRWLKSKHLAVVITAVIFSLVHGEIFSFIPRFVLGIVLGYLFEYGGSILVNVSAHFVNNAIVVVAYWAAQRYGLDIDIDEPFDFGWLLTSCCTVASLLLFWCCFLHQEKNGESLPRK